MVLRVVAADVGVDGGGIRDRQHVRRRALVETTLRDVATRDFIPESERGRRSRPQRPEASEPQLLRGAGARELADFGERGREGRGAYGWRRVGTELGAARHEVRLHVTEQRTGGRSGGGPETGTGGDRARPDRVEAIVHRPADHLVAPYAAGGDASRELRVHSTLSEQPLVAHACSELRRSVGEAIGE